MKQHPHDPEWNTVCWVLKDALSQTIVEHRVHGPFPDEEYDLTDVSRLDKSSDSPTGARGSVTRVCDCAIVLLCAQEVCCRVSGCHEDLFTESAANQISKSAQTATSGWT